MLSESTVHIVDVITVNYMYMYFTLVISAFIKIVILFFFLRKMAIFTSSGSKLPSYTPLKFNNLQTPHLTVEDHYAMFITTLHKSSYFVVGLASSTGGVPLLLSLPVVPLQCSLYVKYPADLNDYIAGTYINVYVTLNLKTVELVSVHNQRLFVYNSLTKPCIVQD